MNLQQITDAAQSYLAVLLTYDLMHIGAVVLLIARLIVDIPPAIALIKKYLAKDKK